MVLGLCLKLHLDVMRSEVLDTVRCVEGTSCHACVRGEDFRPRLFLPRSQFLPRNTCAAELALIDCSRRTAMAANVKKSLIWEFFSLAEDSRYAFWSVCRKTVSRGGDSRKLRKSSSAEASEPGSRAVVTLKDSDI